MIRLVFAVVLLLASAFVNALAAGKAKPPKTESPTASAPIATPQTDQAPARWQKEPDTVLGITLGTSFASANLRICDATGRWSSLCVEQKGPNWYNLNGTGIDGVDFTLWVDDKGIIYMILGNLSQAYFDKFMLSVTDRYGPPTIFTKGEVRTMAGTAFPAVTLTWKGERMEVKAEERSYKVDQSSITFTDNLSMARQEAKAAAARAAVGSKL